MGIVIERGGPRDAFAPDLRQKIMLLGVTYADPQAGDHLLGGRADQDGSISTSEARSETTTPALDM